MTILGGRTRRKLRGVTLVVEHYDGWNTEWFIQQVREGVRKAQGEECSVDVFVLADRDLSRVLNLPDLDFIQLGVEHKTWMPEVFRKLRTSDAVVVVGVNANKHFAKQLQAPLIYLPILVDRPEQAPHFLPGHASDLGKIAKKADTIFFNSEMARSTAETVSPEMCERTRVLSPGNKDVELKTLAENIRVRAVQPVATLTPEVQAFFEDMHKGYRELKSPPRTIVAGSTSDEQAFLGGDFGDIRFLPGVEFVSNHSDMRDVQSLVTIVDDVTFGESLVEWRIKEILEFGSQPIALSKLDGHSFSKLTTGSQQTIPTDWLIPIPEEHGILLEQAILEALRPNEITSDHVVKVVLAGSDFKFSSALIRELESASDISFVVDRAANNSAVNRGRAEQLSAWCDVVVTEFLNEQAVWYSNHLPRHKRLIVHMHGFEVYGTLADRLSVDGVFQIVVPSQAYKNKVIELRGWPEHKLTVIPNSGSLHDLSRPKVPGSRFALGLVGWVPSLKRIDRALDVLEHLIEQDGRYALEVRGAPPWDYTWEWNTPAHRDMYVEVLRRLKQSKNLANHVTFSPFGPDVGNWLRGIGWVLSPSFRESFHLAPVEGMLSGSVPVVWSREGAEEIFGKEWLVDDAAAAARRILQANSTATGWSQLSHVASSESAAKYSEEFSRRRWHELISNNTDARDTMPPEDISQEKFVSEVSADKGDFLAAWEHIQKYGNPALSVSQEYGLAHSAWVRGHIRLPARLLSLQHSARKSRSTMRMADKSFLLIQIAELGRETPRDDFGAAGLVLLKPPAGSPEASNYIPSYFTGFEPLVSLVGTDPSDGISLEEHIEVIAQRLIEEAQASGVTNFRVEGPYWAVLAALFATQETGGFVDWDLSVNSRQDAYNFLASSAPVTDDPVRLASLIISQMVRRVWINSHDPSVSSMLEMFSAEQVELVSRQQDKVPSVIVPTLEVKDSSDHLPKVSIILPSYRTDGSLFFALDSIAKQTYPAELLEVQVVLNGTGKNNRDQVQKYIAERPGPQWNILESSTGVAAARNEGLAKATGNYITFLDDDDYIEPNYVTAMVAVAQPDTVVAADMVDVDKRGNLRSDTNAVRRVKALGYEQVPAFTRAGLFAAAGAKLIPRAFIEGHRFDRSLSSGEDVAFLGKIVASQNTKLVASHRVRNSAYVRLMSENSISRPEDMTVRYGVLDRVAVAYELWSKIVGSKNPKLVASIENAIIRPQVSVITANLQRNSSFREPLLRQLEEYESAFTEYLAKNYNLPVAQNS